MDILKRACIIEVPATRRFLMSDEFVVGKNEILWVDKSFKDMIPDGVVKRQKRRQLACDVIQKPSTSRQIVDAIGGIRKAEITRADLLAAIRSGALEKDVRYICIIDNSAIRIDWLRNGWYLRGYDIDVIGEWSIGRKFISRGK